MCVKAFKVLSRALYNYFSNSCTENNLAVRSKLKQEMKQYYKSQVKDFGR